MSSGTDLKNNLSAHGCVAKRFKMLTYYVYAPLFHRSAPPILGISQSSTCFLLNPDLIFEIGSNLNMTGNMILSKSRVVNRVNLIQTLNKESNVVQRLPVDLKALVFVFKHLFIDKTTTR
jgi:hypothetical protein